MIRLGSATVPAFSVLSSAFSSTSRILSTSALDPDGRSATGVIESIGSGGMRGKSTNLVHRWLPSRWISGQRGALRCVTGTRRGGSAACDAVCKPKRAEKMSRGGNRDREYKTDMLFHAVRMVRPRDVVFEGAVAAGRHVTVEGLRQGCATWRSALKSFALHSLWFINSRD